MKRELKKSEMKQILGGRGGCKQQDQDSAVDADAQEEQDTSLGGR